MILTLSRRAAGVKTRERATVVFEPVRRRAAAALAAGFVAMACPVEAQTVASALDRDLALLLQWLEGRFDNELQTFWQDDLGVPPSERHGRVHSLFRAIEAPQFGAHVLYEEQYSDGDPAKVLRQRVYAFSADEAAGAIRLRIHTPKAPEKLLGAARDPARIARLKLSDTIYNPGCDVLWTRRINQFVGAVEDGACRAKSESYGEIVVDEDHTLTESELWISERATTPAGAPVFGHPNGVPQKLRKVRPFECWTAVLRGARHGDSGEGLNDWQFARGGWLHDQGGVLAIVTDEAEPRTVRLRLRRVEWPTGTNRPSLTLYVMEGDSERAVSYAWAEYDAERIGINLRWLQASCTHEPARLYDGG